MRCKSLYFAVKVTTHKLFYDTEVCSSICVMQSTWFLTRALCSAGLAWAVWFESIQASIEAKEPEFAAKLHGYQQQSKSAVQLTAAEEQTVPWRGFLRNRPVQALAYAHFCNNW